MAQLRSNKLKTINIHNSIVKPSEHGRAIEGHLSKLGYGTGRGIHRILLISPPDVGRELFSLQTFRRGRYTNYPPYGLGVLAANLRMISTEPDVLNLNNEILKAAAKVVDEEGFDHHQAWSSAVNERIRNFKPDLIVITCMFSQTHKMFCDVTNYINKRHPGLLVVVGGVHVTNSLAVPETRKKLISDLNDVNFFFYGEGDVSIKQFVKFINGEEPVESVGQLWYRLEGDALKIEKDYKPDLATLSVIPAHDLIDPKEHSKYGKLGAYFYLKGRDAIFANVLANRGCRAQCTFCSVRNFNGVGVRRRPVTSVIDELKLLEDKGVNHVMWLDDDFLYKESMAIELFNEMVRNNIKITWDCTNGVIAASCSHEVIDAAEKSGCIGLSIGMESGNADILKSIRKPGTIKSFLAAAENIKKFPKIYSRVFLIIGFPGETYSQIHDTLTVAKEMGLDWYQIQVLQPLPNTPIYNKMVEEGLINPDDFAKVRYTGGTFGKNAEKTNSINDVLAEHSIDSLSVEDKSLVVPATNLQAIWAKLVIELNYKKSDLRLMPEVKIKQLLKNYEYVSEFVAPNDMFALYMRLESMRILGMENSELERRLLTGMHALPQWKNRFHEYGFNLAGL